MRAIDADACESYFWEHLDDNGMAAAMNAINDMPTIEPQRKKGMWEMVSQHENPPTYIYSCSECRHKSFGFYNYCPNCGAEME